MTATVTPGREEMLLELAGNLELMSPNAHGRIVLALEKSQRTEIVAALRRAAKPADEGWQDISTAPYNGTIVDLWCTSADLDGRATDCAFRNGTWQWEGLPGEWHAFMACEITHWKALPAGPVSTTTGEPKQ